MLDDDGVIQRCDVVLGVSVDDDEFLAVFRHRYEIAAGQIGAGRRTVEALPCISFDKRWLSGLVHGVVLIPVTSR